ncbi:MAG: DUF1330 domain-containing protein [Xanthobacteraceae bacterium]
MKRFLAPALTLLAGVAIGAVVVQSLHAQTKMPGFYIAEINVRNQDAYMKEFVPAAVKSLQDAGGKFVVRGGNIVVTQGAAPAARIVVLQFPSIDRAQGWWNSQGQKEAQVIGDKYATFRSYIVEGLAP